MNDLNVSRKSFEASWCGAVSRGACCIGQERLELISVEVESALMSPEGGALAGSLEWGRR